jgi:hypothetical protein
VQTSLFLFGFTSGITGCLQEIFSHIKSLLAQLAAVGRCEEDIIAEVYRGLSQDSAVAAAAHMPSAFMRKDKRVGIPSPGHAFSAEERDHLQRLGADTLDVFTDQMNSTREVSVELLHRVQRILVTLLSKYAGPQVHPAYVTPVSRCVMRWRVVAPSGCSLSLFAFVASFLK